MGQFLICLKGLYSSLVFLPNWSQIFTGSLLPLRHSTAWHLMWQKLLRLWLPTLLNWILPMRSVSPTVNILLMQTTFASFGGDFTDVSIWLLRAKLREQMCFIKATMQPKQPFECGHVKYRWLKTCPQQLFSEIYRFQFHFHCLISIAGHKAAAIS